MEAVVIAAVVTGLLTLAVKILEWYLAKKDPVVKARDYRAEIIELTERVDALEAEVDSWRTKYYSNEEEIVKVRRVLIDAGVQPPPRPLHKYTESL